MNVVDNGGDEFLMTEIPMDGILREEKPKWVLDNPASSHICNDRSMFETLNGKGQFGEIKVGSKQMMKIKGVGSVRFKLHDGSVKTALNVKYVQGAARNILSLGVLTSWEALQGRTCCGGNKGKKKIKKRVHFSDKDEVLRILSIDEALEEKQPAVMKDDVWKTMQKKASSTIRLALAPEIKYSVLKEKTPKDIWDKLTNIYASKSLTHRLFLKMELYSLKLEEGSNLHDHINSFNQLVCQLANVDDAIKDEEQALLMLSSLPKSYKPFVQTMLTGRTTLTFEDVLKALRDNERMKWNDSSSCSDKLLLEDDSERGINFQRGSSKGRSKSRIGGDRDMSGKKKVDGGEMNVVDNGGDEFLMTEIPMDGILREEKPKWVLDNAASSHICNDRAMFETLNGKGQFGEIKVGSKQMMKIEDVGSVRFKLHYGSVKTALNVKYVQGAARNILSLGVLTSRKVYKRDQLVIRGRKIPNNLCYLEGEDLQGRTCCGGNKGKKKIEKRVHFSDKYEVLGILNQQKAETNETTYVYKEGQEMEEDGAITNLHQIGIHEFSLTSHRVLI
ncbi:hypothetical protein Tco_1429664 [Tanacetum coccineum]